MCVYIYIYIHIKVASTQCPEEKTRAVVRRNHFSDTTCLAQVFFNNSVGQVVPPDIDITARLTYNNYVYIYIHVYIYV